MPKFKRIIESRLREDDDDLTMDDLPAYDTPKMPDTEEAEYDGKEVTLYDPFSIEDDESDYAVYVRGEGGGVERMEFGSGDMEIKRDQPGRLKNFRARFNCDQYSQQDKNQKGFWNCLFWRKDLSVSDILNN